MKKYDYIVNETKNSNLWNAIKNNDLKFVEQYAENNSLNFHYRNITPLIRACYNNNQDMVILMLRKGADIEFRDIYNYTPLENVVYYNMINMIKLLLENGANPNIDIELFMMNNINKKSIRLLYEYGMKYKYFNIKHNIHKFFDIIKDFDFDLSSKNELGRDIIEDLDKKTLQKFKEKYPKKYKKYLIKKQAKKFNI